VAGREAASDRGDIHNAGQELHLIVADLEVFLDEQHGTAHHSSHCIMQASKAQWKYEFFVAPFSYPK
jgi:hypothetical protein